MPLRDHFRLPVKKLASWEGFHGMWPATMVQRLAPLLPLHYTAEPRAHLGSYFEIDVSAYEDDEPDGHEFSTPGNGGVATAAAGTPGPTLTVDLDFPEQYAYEVLVYDQDRGRHLVAAVEIVSPANKDRGQNRQAFVTKCAALLQQGVCVSIVDLVTVRRINLYAELLKLLETSDPAFGPKPPPTYAVTCRRRNVGQRSRLESWAYPLVVGQPLPPLPIWLAEDFNVTLDLDASYEDACRVFRIP
jgi:hypothetical protein